MRRALKATVAELNPGAFAFVMATGIVSIALDHGGGRTASAVLLWIALAGYAVLAVAYVWRLARMPRRVGADMASPRAFGFLTLVAGSNVVASRLVADGRTTAAAVFLIAGTALWLTFDYGVPLTLMTSRARRPSLDQVNGTWFLWAVGTQSVAVACATLSAARHSDALAAAASVCWGIGLMQYLLTAALALARLLVRPLTPQDVSPPYWVFMGSGAISVLAGAKLLGLPDAGGLVPRAAVQGVCGLLWAFCSWLVPLLLALGVWRYLLRGLPLRYDSGLWSVVFPLGMYGVATRTLGAETGTGWLHDLGGSEEWAAAAVWTLVMVAMIAAGFSAAARARDGGASDGDFGSEGV